MRTTIDIPESDHALFTNLARAQQVTLGKLIVELARRGLEAPAMLAEAPPRYAVDPVTGLGLFRSGRPITNEDVKAFVDEC